MFNFIEKKSFFYFSSIITLLFVVFMYSDSIAFHPTDYNNKLFMNVFFGLLIAMMILYEREHKEVMKILLASFFTTLFFNRTDYIFQSFAIIIANISNFSHLSDSIRITISHMCSAIVTLVIPILFLNHFILNFNGKASKYVINANKFFVVLMAIATAFDISSLIIVTIMSKSFSNFLSLSFIRSFLNNTFPLFCCLSIVSVEAFINSRRAEKVAVERKLSKSYKNSKKSTSRK